MRMAGLCEALGEVFDPLVCLCEQGSNAARTSTVEAFTRIVDIVAPLWKIFQFCARYEEKSS